MKRVRLYKWISTLTPEEVEANLLCLRGEILDGFKVEFIHDSKLCLEDHLYMLTSTGVQRWLNYYKTNFTTNRSQKNEIDTLAQRILESFTERRSGGFVHLGFWETKVEDVISIPDMPSINISNSPGAIVSTGNNNRGNTNNNSTNISKNSTTISSSEDKKKPIWLRWVCGIFIGICIVWLVISILMKYLETNSFDGINLDWKEFVSFGGILFGLLVRVF